MSLLRKWSHLIRFVVVGQDGLRGYPAGGGSWVVHGRKAKHTLRLRPGTTDFNVFKHIFVDPAYSLRRLYCKRSLAARYEDILARGKRPLILDCGANNGCSAIWFNMQYPQARVVAIEPEAGNFAALQANVAGTAVEALNKAVGSAAARLAVVSGGDETAFRTVPAADAEKAVDAITIAQLVGSQDELYIVKIDIEGYEHELFSSNTAWIDDAALIVIELHDHMLPGRANSRPFFDALTRAKPRDFTQRGENIFSIKID